MASKPLNSFLFQRSSLTYTLATFRIIARNHHALTKTHSWPSTFSRSYLQAPTHRMVSTEALRADKLFDVKDHVCVVTGGGTGIGLMYVQSLLSRPRNHWYTNILFRCTQALAANGARVYITGRRMEALENAAKTHSPANGGKIIP